MWFGIYDTPTAVSMGCGGIVTFILARCCINVVAASSLLSASAWSSFIVRCCGQMTFCVTRFFTWWYILSMYFDFFVGAFTFTVAISPWLSIKIVVVSLVSGHNTLMLLRSHRMWCDKFLADMYSASKELVATDFMRLEQPEIKHVP